MQLRNCPDSEWGSSRLVICGVSLKGISSGYGRNCVEKKVSMEQCTCTVLCHDYRMYVIWLHSGLNFDPCDYIVTSVSGRIIIQQQSTNIVYSGG